MKEYKSISIESFEHYREITLQTDFVLFRGQNKDYDLKPGIARQRNRKNLLQTESKVFDNFKKRFQFFEEYKSFAHKTDWDFLVDAQHFGLKTRLLDWSINPFVALWFATSLDLENNGYGVVWIYKVQKSKIIDYNALPKNPFGIKKTIVFQPKTKANGRVYNQKSWFTAHYFDEIDYSLPFNKQEKNGDNLTKLTIPNSKFPELRNSLNDQKDISAETLFNSLDKMCEDINKTFAPN